MKNKTYETVSIEILTCDGNDIITTSSPGINLPDLPLDEEFI